MYLGRGGSKDWEGSDVSKEEEDLVHLRILKAQIYLRRRRTWDLGVSNDFEGSDVSKEEEDLVHLRILKAQMYLGGGGLGCI